MANNETDCAPSEDRGLTYWDQRLKVGSWINRGLCVRQGGEVALCYQTLSYTLENLSPLQSAEYNGAAGVLALLPTVGALLGAPTSEIWRLLTIVPFGGVLAMSISFGGAILPIKVEDYEPVLGKGRYSASSFSLRNKRGVFAPSEEGGKKDEDEIEAIMEKIMAQIQRKLRSSQSARLKQRVVWLGVGAMLLLFIGAQAAMIVVEQGALLPLWCASRGWFHVWYFLVTVSAIANGQAQLPFSKQLRLFLSDVPYDIAVEGGDDFMQGDSNNDGHDDYSTNVTKALENAMGQLKTIAPAAVYLGSGSSFQTARARNTMLVVISVIDSSSDTRAWGRSSWRLLTKSISIAVFVLGTTFFASAQLLALPMATMALTCLTAAAVFGRAIASYMTAAIGSTNPMTHVIVNTQAEAYHVMARVMMLMQDETSGGSQTQSGAERGDARTSRATMATTTTVSAAAPRAIQIEHKGHIFVKGRRVASRYRLWRGVLGLMVKPFDLASLTEAPALARRQPRQPLTSYAALPGSFDGVSEGHVFNMNTLSTGTLN